MIPKFIGSWLDTNRLLYALVLVFSSVLAKGSFSLKTSLYPLIAAVARKVYNHWCQFFLFPLNVIYLMDFIVSASSFIFLNIDWFVRKGLKHVKISPKFGDGLFFLSCYRVFPKLKESILFLIFCFFPLTISVINFIASFVFICYPFLHFLIYLFSCVRTCYFSLFFVHCSSLSSLSLSLSIVFSYPKTSVSLSWSCDCLMIIFLLDKLYVEKVRI